MQSIPTGSRAARIAGLLLAFILLAAGCDLAPLEMPEDPAAGESDAAAPGSDEADAASDTSGDAEGGEDAAHEHVGGMDMGLAPEIDLENLPTGAPAKPDVEISELVDETTKVDVSGHGFRVVCDFSHMAEDDPIVFPGEPGASHLHAFFGNKSADAHSTLDSLMDGETTCNGGRAGNRSSYWVPAMVDTRTGTALAPSFFIVYYKAFGVDDRSTIQAVPNGLRMIAGSADFSAAQAPEHVRYSCDGGSSNGGALPDGCTGEMRMSVEFPACWDGENLDSPDHRSHMAYPTGEGCPDSHPVRLPTITQNISYEVPPGTNPAQHWRLASDMYDSSQPGGLSAHSDVFLAWAEGVAEWFTQNCIREPASCTAGTATPE